MTSDEASNKGKGCEESYSYASQDSNSQYKKQKRTGSPYYEESSSLDSAVLMR